MVQKNNLFILLLLTSALSVGLMSILLSTTKAQEGAQTFTATLEGSENKSNSTGTAKFQVNDNNSKISYWLNVTGIKKINEAHIHNGTSGQSGDIVVSLLSKSKSAKGGTSPPEIDFSGNITKGELLEGKDIADLVSIMSNGSAYVNVHTDKYPRGAIRGQITSTSANTEASPGTNETTVTPPTTNETTVTPPTINETTVTPPTTNETTVTPPTTNETTVTPPTTNETTVTPPTTNETTVTPPHN